jgi:predicted Fe-Mo cluster-binding NifX family protein
LWTYHDQGRIGKEEKIDINSKIRMREKKKFAVPTVGRVLTPHFGHCDQFAIIETEERKVINIDFVEPPVHQPGVYPAFLAGKGVNVIISGGMGHKAQELFRQNHIEVCMGVLDGTPRSLVEQYLNDQLQTGQNLCDH